LLYEKKHGGGKNGCEKRENAYGFEKTGEGFPKM
jgi:hypothetical protein